MIRALSILLAAFTLASCAVDVAGPRTGLDGLPEGLDVQLTVEPGEVRQHEPFSAQLTVTNTTARTIQVATAHGCLAVPRVMRDGEQIPLEGSWWACTAAFTVHTFQPGERWTRVWEMRAELHAQHPGDVGGRPAPEGVYLVQAEFDTLTGAGAHTRPLIERTLLVK